MAEPVKAVEQLVQEAENGFRKMCGEVKPTIKCCAPGRVNLIGGHVDYNEGCVLPMALPMVTVCIGGLLPNATECLVTSSAFNKTNPFTVEKVTLPVTQENFQDCYTSKSKWMNYITATMSQYSGVIKPFGLSIATSVPLGGGLSSSAALEVAVYTFLELLDSKKCTKTSTKALACQKAEHLVGMPCGIMDQFVSVMASDAHLLLVDCRSLQIENILLKNKSVGVLITNSNVKHELSESEYPLRRKNCEDAASILGIKSLRDASLSLLNSHEADMPEVVFKRALHVVSEIKRTEEAVAALRLDDHVKFGRLITESHNSLRDNYNVSCEELDQLVDIVTKIDGVYGSRLVGGGFGGCTVTWLQLDKVAEVIEAIKAHYKGTATFFMGQPSAGTCEIIQ